MDWKLGRYVLQNKNWIRLSTALAKKLKLKDLITKEKNHKRKNHSESASKDNYPPNLKKKKWIDALYLFCSLLNITEYNYILLLRGGGINIRNI